MSVHAAAVGKPIGVLGGTFDPIHNGHLRVAIEAFEALDLDHVRLVPLNQPGHRAGPQASTAQRLAMIERCARAPLMLDDREIVRGGTSYTVDTLTELRAEFPPDVVRMLRIPGLGPKKVAVLLEELHGLQVRIACEVFEPV